MINRVKMNKFIKHCAINVHYFAKYTFSFYNEMEHLICFNEVSRRLIGANEFNFGIEIYLPFVLKGEGMMRTFTSLEIITRPISK